MDNLTLAEQVKAIRSHDIIISPHGAQNSNFAFAVPCTVLLELFPAQYFLPMYLDLAGEVGARTFYMYPGTRERAVDSGGGGGRREGAGTHRVRSKDHQEREGTRREGVRRRGHAGASPGKGRRVVVQHYNDSGPYGVDLFERGGGRFGRLGYGTDMHVLSS